MRGHKLSLVLALAAGALGAGASGCGENAVPERPTYSRDIQPLMQSHCTRCHNGAATPNQDPTIPPDFNPPASPPLTGNLSIGSHKGGPNGNFTTYEGIKAYASGNILMTAYLPYMPPAPSDPLGGWELDVLQRWLQNPLP